MVKNLKTNFQDIHYLRQKPNFVLNSVLLFAEFFYKNIINFKNFLYEKNILKEHKCDVNVICVGNLTTGGVGKTPIVTLLANELSNENKVVVISRGYGAKISNKNPVVIKDDKGLKFNDGRLCGDEPFQLAKKVNKDVIVIICSNRKKAIEHAIIKYGIKVAILDDGFSNRKLKKDKTILVIDSKMRFGNNHLLPYGPLREPISQIKRANEIVIVDKGDENITSAINWAEDFNLPIKVCKMHPKRIYNMHTGANIVNNKEAIAFCAIGQPVQFYDFAKQFYDIKECVSFCDHHKYQKNDVCELIKIAKKHNIKTFITTQKDETKLLELTKDLNDYSFNVLELENILE